MEGVPGNPGLTPRVVDHLYSLIAQSNTKNTRFKVSCSMLELYKDKLRDLLVGKDSKGKKL